MKAPRQIRSFNVQLAAARAIHPFGTTQALCQFGDEAD